MPYRRKHVKSKVHRIMPRRSIFRRLWFWITILLLIIISAIAYFALFYSGFQLENVAIFGNANVKTQDLQTIVFEYATTGLINFWNIKITSASIFLINEDRIKSDILSKFPSIEKVAINKNLPQTLTLIVTERKPLGAFCDSDNKCFSIDQNGVIFEQLSAVPDTTTIVRQYAKTGMVLLGQEVVAENITDAIYKIQKMLEDNFKIDLTEVLITSPVRLNAATKGKWQIYFDLSPNSDINSQITKLNLLLSGGIAGPKGYPSMINLRYIDLRPNARAIVCDNATCGG